MNEVKAVQSLYFSPTGTTKRVLSTISENMGIPSMQPIDITLPKPRESFNGEVQGDLLLVGSPVYHGSPPFLMIEPLNRLEGEGKWAIPVAVYGNRSPDTCVEELTKILRSRGFRVAAAASFSAEHSFSSHIYQIAPGRPDRSDLEIAARFASQIKGKLASGLSEIEISDRLHNFITKEMVDSFPEGYHKKISDPVKEAVWVEFSEDAECSSCMSCENLCPTSAIDIKSREIDDDLCFRCFACTRACPEGVLNYNMRNTSPEYFEWLDKLFSVRQEPKIFI